MEREGVKELKEKVKGGSGRKEVFKHQEVLSRPQAASAVGRFLPVL